MHKSHSLSCPGSRLAPGPRLAIVTGVAGFVGSALARALVASGRDILGVVRASSPRTNLVDFPGRLVEADLRDEGAVMRALSGTQAAELYHVAADYRLWARDADEIRRNNVAMTRAVMRAALAFKIPRIVYTSSVATLLPLDDLISDETHPATVDEATGIYKRSKVEAERIVEAMVASDALPAVIVNPSTPIGPRDIHPTPTGRILVEAASGRIPAYVDTGLNLVHVDDVAQGHILAAEKGVIGRRYVLGGENVMLGDLLAAIAKHVGRRPPRIKLPVAPLFPLALMAETAARVTGREPFLICDSLRMARHRMFYSSARAEAELGYRARGWNEAVGDALEWFRANGMIKE